MNIVKTVNGDTLEVNVSGRLDTTTAPEFEESLKASIDGVKDLHLNLEGLEYISSAGLRVLLSAQKIMNQQGSMKISGANAAIMDIFEMTGFVDILTIE